MHLRIGMSWHFLFFFICLRAEVIVRFIDILYYKNLKRWKTCYKNLKGWKTCYKNLKRVENKQTTYSSDIKYFIVEK